ncbi:hypothetical protein D9757_006583 [Collybiopsis confluens]|uniref:Transmembrane protein n=1 Tax=Collybiopsis confluens TaxID=2823264 RepID=A0A8H5MB93_9AGAR|nr:hypothetical protein D9757_006583 [Collybiopsis confluens]
MTLITAIIFSTIALHAHSVEAQTFNNRRRHSSVGRIVAGVVVGCLVLIALLVLCCIMTRRRRRMRGMGPAGTGVAGGPSQGGYGLGAMPLFGGGGRFGRKQEYNQDAALAGGPGVQNGYAGQTGGRPGATAAPSQVPPPPYADKENTGYAPPPGPPPAAHISPGDGRNEHFVGGFRS